MAKKSVGAEIKLTLGQYLSSIRNDRGITLREVEKRTDRVVSNAYLSQIENDQIKKPNPNILNALAELYGIAIHHSLWYPINLLGGAGVAGWVNPTDAELNSFRLSALVIAILIHTCTSFLVGLLYGALLPILPKHPIVLGGLIAPALWTGLLHSTLALINPFFDSHVNWWWFAVSQVGFGLVAGIVVVKYGHVKRMRGAPLPVRLGLELSEHPDKGQE